MMKRLILGVIDYGEGEEVRYSLMVHGQGVEWGPDERAAFFGKLHIIGWVIQPPWRHDPATDSFEYRIDTKDGLVKVNDTTVVNLSVEGGDRALVAWVDTLTGGSPEHDPEG